jgi:hypothetical protein
VFRWKVRCADDAGFRFGRQGDVITVVTRFVYVVVVVIVRGRIVSIAGMMGTTMERLLQRWYCCVPVFVVPQQVIE